MQRNNNVKQVAAIVEDIQADTVMCISTSLHSILAK